MTIAVEQTGSAVDLALEGNVDERIRTVDEDPGILDKELAPIEARTATSPVLDGTRTVAVPVQRRQTRRKLSFDTTAGTSVRITTPDPRESGHAG